MNRRDTITALLALGAAARPLGARAQVPQKVRRVAYLASISADSDVPRLNGFRNALRGFGYVEGQNLVIDYRYESGNFERLPGLAVELIRLKPDVIVTVATPATLAAKNATRTIPIVFSGVADSVAFGLVDSLRRPGGNVTGIDNLVSVLAGKRLQLLKEAVPKLSRIAVLWEPHTPASAQQWKESQLPARDLGLRLYLMQVSGADKSESAFAEAAKAGNSAFAVTISPTAFSNQARIAELAAKYRWPAVYPQSGFADSGGLMSYGPDYVAVGRVVGRYVDKILKGAKPEDLPVELPTEFELIINLKAARKIGLTIPQLMLLRADRVIE